MSARKLKHIGTIQLPEREGPRGISDTRESVRTPDSQTSPAARRLSVVKFGNAEAVDRAFGLIIAPRVP